LYCIVYCVVPENIHTHPKEGYWKFQGGGGFQKRNILKESMAQKWNFHKGWGVQAKKTFRGRDVDIFWNNALSILIVNLSHNIIFTIHSRECQM